MNRHSMKLVVIFLLFYSLVNSQSNTEDKLQSIDYKDIPQEKVYIHYNSSLLFTGEYLYYSLYCINAKLNLLSDLSKIAYVELVGEDKKSIFQHKINLNKGVGQGDFFLPVTIPSGNYKLVGYTQWMNNGVKNNFFQGDISVINPYQGNQKNILETSDKKEINSDSDLIQNDNTNVKLILNKKKFTKRSKVQLTIKDIRSNLGYGNYSISVKKKDTSFQEASRYSAKTFFSLYESEQSGSPKKIVPPELRGELISGKITPVDSGTLVSNKKVAISIPGENYELKIAEADGDGVFYFNVDKAHIEQDALVQVLGDKEKFRITLDDPKSPDYSDLVFNKFSLSSESKSSVLERSVYNQIRNGYFSVKPDTLALNDDKSRFYGDIAQVFNLDDYTRFPTIRETLVEIVNNAWIKKIDEEQYVFQVRGYESSSNYAFLPLVIIDGVIIQDHSTIVDYNANKIKSIKLIRDLYFLNSQMFQGVIDIETIDGDYYKSFRSEGVYSLALSKPLPIKKYYHEQYDETTKSTTDHIPDYRHQLLWIPNLKFDAKEMVIDFFTSDNVGQYEISLEGFTDKGKPVSIREILIVE
ncbi:hypothetical protein [Aquimarina algiphila]|uniref:hypothetical protein n=1 Tax=Aquimarina algiphila TaxID=2047982 RepID=UPI0024922502|nr:hypothetical protein [Aquimarina algiphila]